MTDRLIVIRNWDKFQHKDVWKKSGGRPPWVKCYTALLHNDAYLQLSFSQRGILHCLWLTFALNGGSPMSQNRLRKTLCTTQGELNWFSRHIDSLSDAGFIEFWSQLSSERNATEMLLEESRVDIQDQRTTSDVAPTNGWTPLDEPWFETETPEVLRDI